MRFWQSVCCRTPTVSSVRLQIYLCWGHSGGDVGWTGVQAGQRCPVFRLAGVIDNSAAWFPMYLAPRVTSICTFLFLKKELSTGQGG